MDEPIPVLEVVQPGALTSIQDIGRRGYQRLGIAEAGAMDTTSLVAANRLVGNPDNAACLEITVVGPNLRCLSDIIFGLAGADLSGHQDGAPLAPGRWYEARSGQTLRFGKRSRGVRAYLSIRGGLQSEVVLGSRSTYIYAGFGGIECQECATDHGKLLSRCDQVSSLALRACLWRLCPGNGTSSAVSFQQTAVSHSSPLCTATLAQKHWQTSWQRLFQPRRVLIARRRPQVLAATSTRPWVRYGTASSLRASR